MSFFLHLDPPPFAHLCAEKQIQGSFHLPPCCVKVSKWCVVGKWNISVDNISLSLSSELIEARPWLSVPLLSLYLHLQGQPRTLCQDIPSPTPLLCKMPLGFRWAFVAFAGTMQAVGCWTMCLESMVEKKVEILTSRYARGHLLPLFLSKLSNWKTHRALPN